MDSSSPSNPSSSVELIFFMVLTFFQLVHFSLHPQMSLCNSCSSFTCNGWGKKNPSVSSRGARGSRSLGLQPICYCGEKSVLRTVKTAKNRGKQFWGCSKYNVREVEGIFFMVLNGIWDNYFCNFFAEWK